MRIADTLSPWRCKVTFGSAQVSAECGVGAAGEPAGKDLKAGCVESGDDAFKFKEFEHGFTRSRAARNEGDEMIRRCLGIHGNHDFPDRMLRRTVTRRLISLSGFWSVMGTVLP